MISEVLCHSPESNFTGNVQHIIRWYDFENYLFEVTATSPRGQLNLCGAENILSTLGQWPGVVSIYRCHLTSRGIPMLKIRWSCDRLIFNMWIPIPGRNGIILCIRPANERWCKCYNVASFLIGWAHTQNNPCICHLCISLNSLAHWGLN